VGCYCPRAKFINKLTIMLALTRFMLSLTKQMAFVNHEKIQLYHITVKKLKQYPGLMVYK